jgi:hypothetical protein
MMGEHYKKHSIEAIDVIEDWELNFNLGNVIKYIARARYKGTELDDLVKALWYLSREVQKIENSRVRYRDNGSKGNDGPDFVREFLSYNESPGEPAKNKVEAEDLAVRHEGKSLGGHYR